MFKLEGSGNLCDWWVSVFGDVILLVGERDQVISVTTTIDLQKFLEA